MPTRSQACAASTPVLADEALTWIFETFEAASKLLILLEASEGIEPPYKDLQSM